VWAISLAQAALLAGLPQAPSAYDPFLNPKDATARRNTVLDEMANLTILTASRCLLGREVRETLFGEFSLLFKDIDEGINPIAGCLPIAVQIPVFFALYKVIFITIEMRQAPFFGWIHDLSAPDPTNLFNLFGLIPYDPTHLPLVGPFLALGIWPLIMGVSMFIQMKMNPEPADPVQKQMFAWMPIIFTFMLGSFPAGLVIYWTWNNTLSVSQQYFIMRKAGVKVELWDNLRNLFSKSAKS
jgi:YidC/Oxa1 family membrane protein insertase